MKKKYVSPRIAVVEIKNELLLAGSDPNGMYDYEEGSGLSKGFFGDLYDEEEY